MSVCGWIVCLYWRASLALWLCVHQLNLQPGHTSLTACCTSVVQVERYRVRLIYHKRKHLHVHVCDVAASVLDHMLSKHTNACITVTLPLYNYAWWFITAFQILQSTWSTFLLASGINSYYWQSQVVSTKYRCRWGLKGFILLSQNCMLSHYICSLNALSWCIPWQQQSTDYSAKTQSFFCN